MGPQDDNLKRRDILQSIQKLDSNISFLNQQKQQLLLQLKSNSIGERSVTISEVISSEEKVKLFKELFRGRTDVYAKHWISRKTGKSGYSPVCKNEWVPKICQRGGAFVDISLETKALPGIKKHNTRPYRIGRCPASAGKRGKRRCFQMGVSWGEDYYFEKYFRI